VTEKKVPRAVPISRLYLETQDSCFAEQIKLISGILAIKTFFSAFLAVFFIDGYNAVVTE
jgi:hypothetical protein